MIRLLKVRIRKAEKYFFELPLAEVIDQMLHRVRAQHRDVLKWRVAQSQRALLGAGGARGRRRRGDSVGAQINDSFLIESKQNGKTKANQMKTILSGAPVKNKARHRKTIAMRTLTRATTLSRISMPRISF